MVRDSHPQEGGKPLIRFRLNRKRAIAAASYLLQKLGNDRNYTKLLKLLFFADRFHVRKYLRPVTSDTFFAMKGGPVASFLYNVFKEEIATIPDIIPDPKDKHNVVLVRKGSEFPELSSTDKEALEFALAHFGHLSFGKLMHLTHAYPDWQKYDADLGPNRDTSIQMSPGDFLLNADPDDPEFSRNRIKDPYPPIPPEHVDELLRGMRIRASQVI